jgi:hypothetical protein
MPQVPDRWSPVVNGSLQHQIDLLFEGGAYDPRADIRLHDPLPKQLPASSTKSFWRQVVSSDRILGKWVCHGGVFHTTGFE